MKRKMVFVRIVSLLFAALLAVSVLAPSVAAEQLNSKTVKRFNVVLVIDGSESLVVKGGTDEDGKRYDAIDLFLALLTNNGNEVGTIVFNEDFLLREPPQLLNGKADKEALSEKIRNAGARNDTDIGGALLEAVNMLRSKQSQNGLDSVIVLFTDGNTDFSGSEKDKEKRKELVRQSEEDLENAVALAQDKSAPIPVYSICLNASGAADFPTVQSISLRTSGDAKEITSAQLLTETFEAFYNLIFTGVKDKRTVRYDENGEREEPFSVPTIGAEEVNIILNNGEVDSVTLTGPDGVLTDAQVQEQTMHGGEYDVIKLVDPKNGNWKLLLKGERNTEVVVNLIYNLDSNAVLEVDDDRKEFTLDETARLKARIYTDGELQQSSAVTQDYQAILFVRSGNQTKSYPMTPGSDGCFTYDLQREVGGGVLVWAELQAEGIKMTSNEQQLSFDNHVPKMTEGTPDVITKTVVVTPISGRHQQYDLSEYITDQETSNLRFEEQKSELEQGTTELNGSVLSIDTGRSHSGDYVVRAYDEDNAFCELTIRMKVINLSVPILILLGLGVLLGLAAITYFCWWLPTHKLFKGTVAVSAIGDTRTPRMHGQFRGSIKLSYFGVMIPGLDSQKTKLRAIDASQIRLCTNTPLYDRGGKQTKDLTIASTTQFYTNSDRTAGIKIVVRSH